ncbi:MAG: hypothetical protein ACKOBY_00430, partial [Cyanobium sp.]
LPRLARPLRTVWRPLRRLARQIRRLAGLGGLASAAVINGAMQQAISARRPTIPVADTDQNLIFASLEPSDSGSVRFTATDGDAPFEASADCRQGQLNGRAPASAAEAQLLHTACQVAFGR